MRAPRPGHGRGVAEEPQTAPPQGTGRPGPATARGRRTRRALLDAATAEFGLRGFHGTGISDITRRAGVAMGSFYTHFASKEAVFRDVVADLSARVRDHVAPALAAAPDAIRAERAALAAFLGFVRANPHLYRIIDEAEFVAPDAYRAHYVSTVARVAERLRAAAARGEMRAGIGEIEAWAIIGMNVFLGLRFGVWEMEADPSEVAARANRLLAKGLAPGR